MASGKYVYILFSLLWISELEHINVQGLPVFAHVAQDNGTSLVQIWICISLINVYRLVHWFYHLFQAA